ncbi:hypothetical protein BDW22DRAFT_1355341 [Trametopsis cervina]|nr:hypothetical protein BDW22DRAFT_1355341 [Trametopsis cervina]
MAPKPRPIVRKSSTASKDAAPTTLPKTQNAHAMPPPPVPATAVSPQGVLVPEAEALKGCLKSAAIRTGQVLRFYSDTRKLHIHRHAPYPPRTVSASLGRELEKYDQICDAMQSHLNRAINVLKRDLERETNRLRAAEEAKAAELTNATIRVPQNTPATSPTTETQDTSATAGSKAAGLPARRQSTISLSSLQRPAFPHKLDLSSAGLRLSLEDFAIPSGLASPVMLAPKSSIPQLVPDFPFGAPGDVTIDLTHDEDVSVGMLPPLPPDIDTSLGSSADKPIELLDIDMELFGGSATSTNAAAPGSEGTVNPSSVHVKQESPSDFGFFPDLQSGPLSDGTTIKTNVDLLASLDTAAEISRDVLSNNGDTGQRQAVGLLDTTTSTELLAGMQASPSGAPSEGQGIGLTALDFEHAINDIDTLLNAPGLDRGGGNADAS